MRYFSPVPSLRSPLAQHPFPNLPAHFNAHFQFAPRLLCVLFVMCGLASAAMAQATSGTITGNVTDPSGAFVPNAKVDITDMDRGTHFSTTSNGEGLFSRTQIPNGRYKVRVEAQGFSTYEQETVVNINEETRVYAKLKTAGTQQTVTVTANEEPVLITDRAEVSTTLSTEPLNDLPTLGQNVTTLETLSPGTVHNTFEIGTNENPQGGQANNTNGLLFGFTNRAIDGADDMDAVLGIEVLNPPPDSLQEMKSTTSNYDAEFGRAGGAFVQYVTKSGTNKFHGDVFEFLRNDFFNAANPFTETNGILPLRFNQFGGALGGPIVKDKLFFFGVYQGQRQRIGSGVVTTVPTQAQRNGDLSSFGKQIFNFNPVTGTKTPFAGNIIPAGLISPVAAKVLALVPAPTNGNLVDNFVGNGSVIYDTNQYDGRVDYYFNDNNRMFGRYDYFASNIVVPSAFGSVIGGPSVDPSLGNGTSLGRNQNLVFDFNHIFSPTFLGDLRYSYFRYRIDVEPNDVGLNTATQVGIPNINLGTSDTSGISNFIFNGSALAASQSVGAQPFALGTSNGTNAPLHELEQLHQFSTSFIKTKGNHSVKFGGDYRHISNFRSPSDTSRRGVFQFNSDVTGINGSTGDAFASFLLGLPSSFSRFQFLGNPTELEWDIFSFVQDQWRVTPKLTVTYGLRYEIYSAPYADTGNAANFDFNTGQLLVANTGSIDRYMNINTRFNNFAPRVGFAYSLTPTTVVRAGYGRSYFPNFFSVQVSQNFPVNFRQDLTSSSGVPLPFTLSQGPPVAAPPAVPANGMLALPTGVSAAGIPLDRKTAYVDMWNLAIQKELGANFSVQAAYVGNVARHLFSFLNVNAPLPGPGASNNNRPFFQQFGYTQDLTEFCTCFSSNYNSLQLSAQRRFSKGYFLTAQYTLSKVLNYGDNSSEFGPYNLASQYGPAGFDRRHAFSLGHEITLPIGPGQPFFTSMSGFAKQVLAGWQFSGVTTAYSGRPFTPVLSSNASLNSNFSLRPDVTGDPNSGIPAGRAFNPAVFVNPAPFTEGNAGRNSLRGPSFVDADWGLSKTFPITERANLKFAWQNFNVFNHPNLGLPNNVVDSTGAGQFTSLETFALPRTMQFSLRLGF
jgi:outer membrane receptor protein involved in Fe transport